MNPPDPCHCHKKLGELPPSATVPIDAFRSLRRQVRELSEIVHTLTMDRAGGEPSTVTASRSLKRRAGAMDVQERTTPSTLAARSMRIVGGVETERFPHCALIGHEYAQTPPRNWHWSCSGVLIHPRVVLSAAHCQVPSRPPNVVALNTLGIHDLGATAEKIQILKSFVHDGYRPNALVPNHDIVVHILSKAASTTPVNVANRAHVSAAERVTLAGFGNNDIYSTRGFGVKREVTVDILGVRRGSENLDDLEARYQFESDDEFVAGNPIMDSCNGDSGGPAYIENPQNSDQYLVAGLTSRGIPEGPDDNTPCGDGGIYTRIDAHWAWIVEVAKKYLNP